MARILGEAGKFNTSKEFEYAKKEAHISLGLMALLGFIEGFLIFYHSNTFLKLISSIVILTIMYYTFQYGTKQFEIIETKKLSYRKGAIGEMAITKLLEQLPTNYIVINDIPTKHGNIDHAVVGPTGIFIIETKHWKGIVSSYKDGELLLNNKPTDKPCIQYFQNRVIEIRNKLLSSHNLPPTYFKSIMVFKSARVDAKWGTTHNVLCMRDDKLIEYILNEKDNLSQEVIEKFARGFDWLRRKGHKQPIPILRISKP